MVPCSALEALVRLAVVEQVADAVHRVFEDRGGGEDNDTDLRIDERNGAEGSDESGEFPGEAEVFERCHGEPGGGVNGTWWIVVEPAVRIC